METGIFKGKSVHITTAAALLTAISTGGYQVYDIANEILNSYATKDDITQLRRDTENIRRELSLDLLDTVIMSYEDKLMILDFEIQNNQATASGMATKKNLERRLMDLRQQRQILRLEISSASN